MRVVSHSNCCGISMIVGFSANPRLDSDQAAELKELYNKQIYAGRLAEITLNDKQIKSSPKTMAMMKKLGFRQVYRFKNSVHNSMVNVFHGYKPYIEGETRYLLKDSPYNQKKG